MCLICVEFQKERMTTGEARRAYSEMVETLEPDHAEEVEEMIEEAERDQREAERLDARDGDLDARDGDLD